MYLRCFTSSFSMFRVARRDWSCWNLRMSSPFTGGCTESWHTWMKKNKTRNASSMIRNMRLCDLWFQRVTGVHSSVAEQTHGDVRQLNADKHNSQLTDMISVGARQRVKLWTHVELHDCRGRINRLFVRFCAPYNRIRQYRRSKMLHFKPLSTPNPLPRYSVSLQCSTHGGWLGNKAF